MNTPTEIVEGTSTSGDHSAASNPATHRSWMDKPEAADPLCGQIVDRSYKVKDRLGSGGMSVVYLAEELITKRLVALKLIRSDLSCDGRHVRRFQLEARAAGKLQHQNIATLYSCGLHENQPYLAMEYVGGESLAQMLERRQTLPLDETLEIARQLCSALAAAQQQRVVHRDIKPSNIVISNDNCVKLIDFGLAKIVAESSSQPGLTKTGEVFGTPLYMSPEQCEGRKVDCRSDYYSVGCVIYQCLTGITPHVGYSPMETIYRHIHHRPLSLKEATLGKEFPDSSQRFIDKLLAKEADNRYQMATEIGTDIDKLSHGEDLESDAIEDRSSSARFSRERQQMFQRIDLDNIRKNIRRDQHRGTEKRIILCLAIALVCILGYGLFLVLSASENKRADDVINQPANSHKIKAVGPLFLPYKFFLNESEEHHNLNKDLRIHH